MDFHLPRRPNGRLKHYAIILLTIIRGLGCLSVLLLTAFLFLVYFTPIFAFALRIFSVHYSRRAISYVFGVWLTLWPFLFEKINMTKVIFSGDSVPEMERVLIISNHRTEVDWMYLWDLALRKGRIGYIKYILKSSLMKLPLFGWAFHVLEFISVERKWEVDEPVIRKILSTFANTEDPLWLAIFPEGTDFTELKCRRSKKFASENGLPILNNVLLPKANGFYSCLEALRGTLDAVYDITIGYKPKCPIFVDNLFGIGPSEVHVHIRRVPAGEIPASRNGTSAWLMGAFQVKDRLLSGFEAEGRFPEEGSERELASAKGILNLLVVACFTSFFLGITILYPWFRIYVLFSVMYMVSATFFSFRPAPVLDLLKCHTNIH